MTTTAIQHYHQIEKAIRFISEHQNKQFSLEAVASHVAMSPTHFQKVFTEWAGVSPKKFNQFLSVQYAKSLIKEQESTLFDVTHELGLSSTSRLHDLFITIEGMTPGEFKKGGDALSISFECYSTLFGNAIVANTHKGICHLHFFDCEDEAIVELQKRFPSANFKRQESEIQTVAINILNRLGEKEQNIHLHLQGTPFQIKVWEALLAIPEGQLATYGKLASQINSPNASRAVGTAIGTNPVAFLIPCHRVIQSTGKLGGYMWKPERKAAIIGWEGANSRI